MCVSKPSNLLNQTVQTCDDVLSYYQFMGYEIEDCIEDVWSKSLFWRIDTPLPWDDARSACKASMADLAVPKSGAHRAIIVSLITLKGNANQPSAVWIGIQRQNGTLKFIDGSEIPSSRWPTTLYPPTYGGCIHSYDCGWAFISWCNNNGVANDNSWYMGFYYCTNLSCNTPSPFVCQIQMSG